MLRWRPFHLVILSLGSIAGTAWAEDPPLCPSALHSTRQTGATQAGPPAGAASNSGAGGQTGAPGQTSATARSGAAGQPGAKAAGSAARRAVKERKPGVADGNIDITSDHADLGLDGSGTLRGNVRIHQGDREIHSNEVEYNSKTNGIRTNSGLEYEDPVVRVTGEGGSYAPATGADLRSATFELRQRAARGSADSLRLTPQGVIDLKGARFTTCPPGEQSWTLRADSVTLDTRSRVGDARSAIVNFEGVPILYLPWVSFPLGSERKSGFLFPTIGSSSRSGLELSVPYYWNIAPNADFTFQPIEYSRRGPDIGGDLRFMNSFDHGQLVWNYLPQDNVFHASRSRVKLTNAMELPDSFRFSIDAENVSDTSYFEDFSQGPEGTSTAFVQQQAAVTYRDEHWSVNGQMQHYQTIDNTLVNPTLGGSPLNKPYARLPSLAVSADYGLGPAQILKYGFESEIVNFNRSIGGDTAAATCAAAQAVNRAAVCANGWRIDLMPQTSLNFEFPGYFIRPGLAWRLTQYELDGSDPGMDRSPSRNLPLASFDTGLVFERAAGSHDQRIVTLEPRMLYLYVPYRYQDELPLFDTAVPDLDPVELFRNNRYVGADRIGDANQVSLGVTSRLLDAHDGRQFLTATFGQTYYFTTPRVLLPGEIARTDSRSDFVAQLALTAFEHWSADLGLQWDPQASRNERSQVNIQYKPAGDSVINLGYRYQRDSTEAGLVSPIPTSGLQLNGVQQVELSGAWPIAQAWNVFFRGIYSIKDDKPLERFAGFEYRACCWKIRFGGRSFVSNRSGSEDTGVYLQLELTGLASVGSASDSFLTEAIRGYAPADSANQKLTGPLGPD